MRKLFLYFCMLLFATSHLFAQPENDIISKIKFRNIGPAFMSGRISQIAKDPKDPSTWYVAVASGNAWKTSNNGTSWTPIFDSYGSFSTGCITVDPTNSNVIWLGTGENQSQRSVSWGDGVYKSLDGGKTWQNMGLPKSEHIGKILVDPRDSDIIYVAAQGPLWADGGERGVYKSVDGGQQWERVLHVSEYTGIADICFDTKNPDIIYASSYQRRRHVGFLVAGGEESRIYKSSDGGSNWKKLSKGLPQGELGRIAITVSPQQANVVYALIAGAEKQSGFYRSEDYGESWIKKNDYVIVDPQYYGEIFADPNRFDCVYAVDVIIHYTEDGGESFKRLNTRSKHVDNHDIVFDPTDPEYLMVGCDGGIYESWDRGDSWKFHSNMPITQFYRVGLDNAEPFYNVYGGTQDNSTLYGPSQTNSRQGITNADWKIAVGGDGFQARIDPEDPNIVYAQSQYAGIVRHDRRTGQRIDIQPQPGLQDDPLRWHWDSPLIISPHNSKRLYYAAQKLFRSDDRGDSWQLLSGDLSRGEDRNQRKVMGKLWSPEAVWKNVFTSPYGTIVSLSESPVSEGLIVVGTDEGLIQISEDGGKAWRKIDRISGVPAKAYVADVFSSNHDRNIFYAVFNNHKEGDFNPYIVKTTDLGKSWNLITKGLEAPQACWSIIEDHTTANLLFAATEFGIYCSLDGGGNWSQMKGGLPTIAFRDLEIQKRENDLVGASFGRGMYVLDNYNVLQYLATNTLSQTTLFPIKEAKRFFSRGDLGYSRKGTFGDDFYSADNPPKGVVFSLYLQENFPHSKVLRKQLEKSNPATSQYPDHSSLKKEAFEQAAKLFLQIEDQAGTVVANTAVKNKTGFQRLAWDFSTQLVSEDGKLNRSGPEVSDGQYTAQLFVAQNGEIKALSTIQSFKVKTLDLSPEKAAADRYAFSVEVGNTLLKAQSLDNKIKEALKNQQHKQTALLNSTNVAGQMKKLEEQRLQLLQLQYELLGDLGKKKRFEYFLPGVMDRLRRVYFGYSRSDQITVTQRDNYQLAKRELEGLVERFSKLNAE